MPRTTIKIEDFLRDMNAQIKHCETVAGRQALCGVVEHFLFELGNYNGFRHTDLFQKPQRVKDDDPKNMTPLQEYNRQYFAKKV